ncbi:MAG: NAD-dependent epimerase/dehydratase family protein [Lautropia sp.]
MRQTKLPDLRDTRFAVSGATGFIGRHLVSLLHDRGAEVVMLRRPGSPTVPFAPVRSHVIDFSDQRACAAALRRLQPTHIVHLAGFANSDRSVEAISRSLDVNLIAGVHFVLGAMDAVPDARVVVSGTLETSNPWEGAIEVGSPYGISKVMLEVLTGSLGRLYGANLLNAKIGMVYGPDDPNEKRLVPTVVRALLRGESPMLSSGTRRCDFVYVGDVAEALMRASLAERVDVPSVDIGTGVLTSIRDMTGLICKAVGGARAPTYSGVLDRPNEQERAANIAATQAAIGWSPTVSLTDGIARTVQWHQRLYASKVSETPAFASGVQSRPAI